MSRKRAKMTGGVIHWSWQLLKRKGNTESDGGKGLRQLQLQLWPRWQLEPRTGTPLRRSLRSSSLWASAKWLLIGSRSMATESAFALWLEREIESAAFGALTVEEVKRGAVERLELEESEVIRYLVRATREGGRFRSDGDIVTMRE